MPRDINLAVDCPDCCTCPTPTTQWDSRSASKTKQGIQNYPLFCATASDKLWLRLTWSGISSKATGGGGPYFLQRFSGYRQWDPDTGILTVDTLAYEQATGWTMPCSAPTWGSLTYAGATYYVTCEAGGTRSKIGFDPAQAIPGCTEIAYADLSDEYTTAQLKTNTVAALPAYDDDWNDTAGSFANLSTDERSYAIRESRYRHIFPVPLVGSGACYRLEWVERFIAEAGVVIDSAEIVTRGVYRPTVSSSGGGGSGLLLVAVMSSTGTVSAIRILHPGTGYTSAPTITVQSATGGGTTSTGWTATVSGGQVTAITGGSAGDYLPTGAFSGGGGSGATITFTFDETGGLATCPLGSGGGAYTSAPTLTITPKVAGSLAARVDLHLGTETARCAAWDGIIPPGYDPGDNTTWPILGDGTNPYVDLPVPAADGTTLVANVRAFCDCSACP